MPAFDDHKRTIENEELDFQTASKTKPLLKDHKVKSVEEEESRVSQEDEEDEEQGYYLEEFGKLQLPYDPEKIGVFHGSNNTTYIGLIAKSELIIFII